MNKKHILPFILLTLLTLNMNTCTRAPHKQRISPQTVEQALALSEQTAVDAANAAKGIRQVARLWQPEDGNNETFIRYCCDNYIADPDEKQQIFLKISHYLEALYGHFNEMTLQLQRNVQEDAGPLHPIDETFAAYNPGTHLSDDLYANKLAFFIALNFPQLTLEEKEALGDNRLAWAYARLGDQFAVRIPAAIQQACSQANADADVYISAYNLYAGNLLNPQNKTIFPADKILLSHWNLRDEIKSNYNHTPEGLDRQQTLYEAMKRIISQEIPSQIINTNQYNWNPYTNTLYQNKTPVAQTPENNIRYEKLLRNFKTLKAVDAYAGNTYIQRNFDEDMEISVDDAQKLFHQYLSAPEMKTIGQIIEKRLGRKLQAFDVWYDGFKARSKHDEEKLSAQTRQRYPNAPAMQQQLPAILAQLGFNPARAQWIADKIAVDPARGSGHAWGAAMKGQKSHLRTRIPANGIDYKGYNIAIHEFGHNVEQTLSLYDVDYYLLNGVPNTAFTEALAFVFQKRDLELLGVANPDAAEKNAADILDKAWHLYEIAGVSMVDIAVWKWLYAHPDASPNALKEAVVQISKDVWNQYFAPVFDIRDETLLAIYSHMISYPLYLSAYTFGHIIQFQLEKHLAGKNFATEVDRIYRLGRLTPNRWMQQATGQPLSVEPLLQAVRNTVE
jgi:hypothetical protein